MAGPGKRKEEEKMNFGVMGPGVIAEKFAGACELCCYSNVTFRTYPFISR